MDFNNMYGIFEQWLLNICKQNKPDNSIIAYNFGIFEAEAGFSIYLTGSKEYDSEDSDWACNDDFEPKTKYLELNSAFTKDKTWEQIQNAVSQLVIKFVNSPHFPKTFLSKAEAITVGFDDGDLIKIK